MVPLTVPEEDRRIVLRSFWLLISLIFAALTSIGAWIIGVPWWIAGILVFVVAGSLAFNREHVVRRLYHAWNNRIIRPLSDIVTAILLRLCLFLIFTATGRAGSRVQLTSLAGTMWTARGSNVNRTSNLPFVSSNGTAPTSRGWLRGYLRWAFQSHNAWAVSLIPFLFMLRMVATEEPTSSGANIYTLF